jgi:hypothetical protein
VVDVRGTCKELLGIVVRLTNAPSQLKAPGRGIHTVVLIKAPEGVFVEFSKGVQRILSSKRSVGIEF